MRPSWVILWAITPFWMESIGRLGIQRDELDGILEKKDSEQPSIPKFSGDESWRRLRN